MALTNSGGHPVDGRPVADVADLVLAADLTGHAPEPFLAAGDEDAVPALLREPSRDGGADPRASARDDRYRQTRTTRVASTRLPPTWTTARSVWRPRLAPRARHVVA
jgi:hypothetical protein